MADITDAQMRKIAQYVWEHKLAASSAGGTLEDVRKVSRDITGQTSVLVDPRNNNGPVLQDKIDQLLRRP